jgi:asparagine synthase (glutamine-hydrolysing)
MYKAAADKKVDVFLDGLDGDTTVSHGLHYLTELARSSRFIRFIQEGRALARRNPTAYDFRSVVRECGVRPLAPQVLVRAWRTVRRVTNAKTPEGEVIQSSFVARQPTPILSEPDDDHFVDARHAHWRALCTPLIPYTMELADATSAAFGIETRYPFFDSRLVEFCLAIPAEQKLRNGWTRWVMRNAMSGLLPEPVQWRPSKADLSPNFHRMLFERDGATIRDVVESSRLESVTEYVDPVAVRSRFRRWAAQSGALRQDGRMLFSITLLTLWVERFREAASQRSGSETDN